jgi:hypothetical protein
MKTKRIKIRVGSVLVLAVIMVVILLIIGLALIRLGLNARLQAIHSQLVINAKAAADAGLTQAVKAMRYAFDHNLHLPVPGDSGGFPESGTTYIYTIAKDPTASNIFDVDSTGTAAGTVSRTVHSKITLTVHRLGFKERFILDNGGCVATIPPGGDLTIQTNSKQRAAVVLRNGVIIPGDVLVNPSGNPDTVIDTKNNAEIQGEARPAAETIDFKNWDPPTGLGAAAWPPSDYNSVSNTYTLSSSGTYSGPITIKNGDKVRVVGDVSIYIAGKFTIQQGAWLIIGKKPTGQSSTLKLYLGADMQADQLSNITNEYVVSNPPSSVEAMIAASSLSLYGTANDCAALPCQTIVIQNSGNFFGAIYAPNAEIDIRNSGDLYVSQIEGYEALVHNSGCLYAVEVPVDPNATSFSIVRWWED